MLLETAILRQNSQFRGFLVTGYESYLKSYYEGRDEFDKVVVELKGQLGDVEKQALLEKSRLATLAWRADWGDRIIAEVRAGKREQATAADPEPPAQAGGLGMAIDSAPRPQPRSATWVMPAPRKRPA